MKRSMCFALIMIMTVILCIPSAAEAAQIHRVAKGDTLYLTANQYGISIDELLSHNRYVRNPNTIHPGQVLIVPKQQNTNVYTVRSGDTLYKISLSLDIPMAALAEENKLQNWNALFIGQKLNIPKTVEPAPVPAPVPAPAPSPNVYVVKNGDSLYKISKTLGVSMTALAEANGIKDWNLLYTGQTLTVPSVIPSPVVPPKQPEPNFQESVSQLAKTYSDTFYLKGSSTSNKIALTFDDGPHDKYTTQILNVLKQHNVPATFFVLGSKVEKHPEIVNRIISEGHIVGNHTWNHPDLRKSSKSQLISEMQRTEDSINKFIGKRTSIMRPPYGAVSSTVIEGLRDMNYKVINWSADSVDWRDQDVDKILINTLTNVRQGGILLFHDGGGEGQSQAATVAALPELIHTLKMQGYQFVTVDKLLNIPAYK